MSESDFWHELRPKIAPYGAISRIENKIELGTPDVSYCLRRSPITKSVTGWIELKHIPSLPMKENTPIKIEHYTLDQILWAEKWANSGGHISLLIKAGKFYIGIDDVRLMRLLYEKKVNTLLIKSEATIFCEKIVVSDIVKLLTR